MRLSLCTAARLSGTMSALRHSPPPCEAPPSKHPRRIGDNAPNSRSAKLERKRLQSMKKNYDRAVAKSGEPPILHDIRDMIGTQRVSDIISSGTEFDRVAPINEQLTITIDRLSAHGDGLALSPYGDRVIAVPFALPGETVRVYPYSAERLYLKARLIERLTSSSIRRDDMVSCRYFGTCGGCQYQMIPYEHQLELKQRVVRNAFMNYSKLDENLLPEVLPTMGSPATMGYRTKLTPHFDLPLAVRKGRSNEEIPPVAIGFDSVATGRVMDIEVRLILTRNVRLVLPQLTLHFQKSVHLSASVSRRSRMVQHSCCAIRCATLNRTRRWSSQTTRKQCMKKWVIPSLRLLLVHFSRTTVRLFPM